MPAVAQRLWTRGDQPRPRGGDGAPVWAARAHVQYTVTSRNAHFFGRENGQQAVQTLNLAYNFIGQRGFGAVEWRPEELAR